jgi:hypothetical protein
MFKDQKNLHLGRKFCSGGGRDDHYATLPGQVHGFNVEPRISECKNSEK